MVCNRTFDPYPFKIAHFVQSKTSLKYIISCEDYYESPVSPVPADEDPYTDYPDSQIFYPFHRHYHAQHLTSASFVAIFSVLNIVNIHPSLESLMPGHQWQIRLISFPPSYLLEDKGKEFDIILELCEVDMPISYNCIKYMDRRYGVEECTGHELGGTPE